MKLTILRKLLLPISLLVLGTASAYGAEVCSNVTTLQDALNSNVGGGCTAGNAVFSNFQISITTNGNMDLAQEVDLSNAAFNISANGTGGYTVVADFNCSSGLISGCSQSNPAFAVIDTNTGGQAEQLSLTYLVTEVAPDVTLNGIAGVGQLGILNGGNFTGGRFTKTACSNQAYSDAEGNGCTTTNTTVEAGVWNAANSGQNGDPNVGANQTQQTGSAALSGLTSVGVMDKAFIYSGDDLVGAGNACGRWILREHHFGDSRARHLLALRRRSGSLSARSAARSRRKIATVPLLVFRGAGRTDRPRHRMLALRPFRIETGHICLNRVSTPKTESVSRLLPPVRTALTRGRDHWTRQPARGAPCNGSGGQLLRQASLSSDRRH